MQPPTAAVRDRREPEKRIALAVPSAAEDDSRPDDSRRAASLAAADGEKRAAKALARLHGDRPLDWVDRHELTEADLRELLRCVELVVASACAVAPEHRTASMLEAAARRGAARWLAPSKPHDAARRAWARAGGSNAGDILRVNLLRAWDALAAPHSVARAAIWRSVMLPRTRLLRDPAPAPAVAASPPPPPPPPPSSSSSSAVAAAVSSTSPAASGPAAARASGGGGGGQMRAVKPPIADALALHRQRPRSPTRAT